MLILSRKPEETIIIADNIEIKVLKINGNQVKIGITAPDSVKISRDNVRPGKDGSKKDTSTPA